MVARQHYRWDFIGLSTDNKPTPSTSEKVVDGSTFYCSDNSKLYVWYKTQWYEKTVSGGGGGTDNFNALTNRPKYNGSLMTGDTDIPEVITYSDFTGTDGTAAGTAGLVPAPATTDAGKFLKADGTWDTAGGGSGPTVVQTTGTSTTDVMSQNAVTSMVFADPSTTQKVNIAGSIDNSAAYGTVLGYQAAIVAGANRAVAIGYRAAANESGSVALGTGSGASRIGEVNIGSVTSTAYGFNNSNYRLLSGVYDGQSAHDAATKGQLDSIAIQNAGAPTTSTVGTVGQLLEDTTNGKLYQCTAVTPGTDPDPDTYTWSEVGAGGSGPTVVQTTGTSTTDVMSQNAVTSMVFADPASMQKIKIGAGTSTNEGTHAVEIGEQSSALGNYSVALGYDSTIQSAATNAISIRGTVSKQSGIALSGGAHGRNAIAIGTSTYVDGENSIALGAGATTSTKGVISISTTNISSTAGYNSSQYRLITGLYDGQSAHDAATVGQITPLTDSSAPTTATVGRLGQIFIDTTNADAYMCVEADTVTPAYTWKKITP